MIIYSIFILGCSWAFPDGRSLRTGNPNCLDTDLGEDCLNLCHADLIICYNNCKDDPCKTACNRAHPACIDG